MIVSVHLADIGRVQAQRLVLRGLNVSKAPGMRYGEVVFAADLGRRIPRPHPGRLGLIAAWDDDIALDRFLAAAS